MIALHNKREAAKGKIEMHYTAQPNCAFSKTLHDLRNSTIVRNICIFNWNAIKFIKAAN